MAYVYQKFPQMIYHVVYEPMVVKSEAELAEKLSEGWSEVPPEQTPEGMLKAKIAWHESQIEILSDNLAAIAADEPKSADFICPECGEGFKTRLKFAAHKRVQHPVGKASLGV